MRGFPSAVTAVVVLAGCVASDPERGATDRGVFVRTPDGRAVMAAVPGAATFDDVQEGPWSWEDLAVRAGLKSDAARVAVLESACKRLKAEGELAWKDPEIRLGYDWANVGGRKDEFLKTPDPLDNRRSHGRDNGLSVGVRFYVPNPFVNRYLRERVKATDDLGGAKVSVEAYAVYSEVKMLCYEATRTARELEAVERQVEVSDELRRMSEESLNRGVFKSPLDAIRAESKAMRLRIKGDALRAERAKLVARIAYLADIPVGKLEICAQVPALPAVADLSVGRLTEIAFARRPDLAEAVAELKSAEAEVGAAKSANIPWFRYVEAAYKHGTGWEDSYGKHTSDYEDGFELKSAIYLPVFTWLGKSVSLAESVRDLADTRLTALRDSIRHEVSCAVEDYRLACEFLASEASQEFATRMEQRIAEYAGSEGASAEEAFKARSELMDYRMTRELAEMLKVEAALRLESVIGGPCPVPAAKAEAL